MRTEHLTEKTEQRSTRLGYMKNKPFGYLLGAIAACTYGMNPLFSLPLYSDGLKPDMVLLLRYGFALPIVALVVRLRGRSFKVEKDQWPFVIALGLLMALSSKALFHSYNYMDAGIASTLLFVYPLMVALIMAFFFHEKLTLPTGFSIALALIGIVMLYQGGQWGHIKPGWHTHGHGKFADLCHLYRDCQSESHSSQTHH